MQDRALMDVVCGVIERDRRILVGLRPQKSSSSGFWEFPGGKIEDGESHQNALSRELGEELGIVDVELGELVVEQTLHRPEGPYRLFAYRIKSYTGEPQNLWHDKLYWCPVSTLNQLPLLPSNVIIAEKHLGLALHHK
jgi:mutator protein MutT